MKKRRVMAMLLAGVMFGGLLTGCSGGQEQGGGTSSGGEDEIVELNFYMSNSPVVDQERIMDKANEIIEKEIGAHLNLIMVDGSTYAEKMNLMINTGDPWDLCFTASWGGINFYENAQKGAYADLTELLPELAPETYSRIPEGLWQGVTVDGKIYASVNYQQWGAASRMGFKFREDIANEVGFDWQSLKGNSDTLSVLRTIGDDLLGPALEAHPDMIGWETSQSNSMFLGNPLYWDMEEVGDVKMPGWVSYDDPTTVINQFETDEFMEYCRIMRDWYNKGYVRADGATVTDTSPDRTAARFVAEITTGWPDTVDFPDNPDMAKMSMTTAETAPAVGVSTTRTVIRAAAGPNAAVAVNAQSENIEKAVELIELLNTNDELYMLITQGEEGVDYDYKEDGTYYLVDGMYNFNYNEWQIGQSYSPDFTRALYSKNEAGELAKESQSIVFEADKTAEVSPLTGFVFDSTNVRTEIANCISVIDEMVPALSAGSVDPEEQVPAFLERLKDAGADKIIEEKQAQLDEWLASK